MMASTLETLADFLATYSLHSSVLLLMAWLADRWLRKRPELASAVWKTALVGGVATAALQVGGVVEPVTGHLHLAATSTGTLEDASGPAVVETFAPTSELLVFTQDLSEQSVAAPQLVTHGPSVTFVSQASDAVSVAATGSQEPGSVPSYLSQEPATALSVASVAAPGSPSVEPQTFGSWRNVLLGIWFVGGLFGLVRIMRAVRELTRQLRGRRTIVGGGVRRVFDRLCHAAGLPGAVRLSCTHRIDVPLAMGVLRPEVCIPRRVLRELDPETQESLLAHELAHVIRRDPFWRFLGAVCEAVLFFQPLNRIANRKLGTYAEYLSDEWAASQTQRPLALARCLTEVAGWVVRRPGVRMVPAMAGGQPSVLSHRVKRLLEFERPKAQRPQLSALISATMFLGVVAVTPGVFGSPEAEPENMNVQVSQVSTEVDGGSGPALGLVPESLSSLGSLGPMLAATTGDAPMPAAARGSGVVRDQRVLDRAARRVERRQARALKSKRKKLERLLEKAEKQEHKARQQAREIDRKVTRASRELEARQRGLSAAEVERQRSREAQARRHGQHHPHQTNDEQVVYRYQNGDETVVIRIDPEGQFVVVAPDGQRYELDARAPNKPHRVHRAPRGHQQRRSYRFVVPEDADRLAARHHRELERQARELERQARAIEREVRKQLPNQREIERQARAIEREVRKQLPDQRELERQARAIEREIRKQLPDQREIERRAREIEREIRRQLPNEKELERQARALEREIRKQLPNEKELERELLKHLPNEKEIERRARAFERELRKQLPSEQEIERRAKELEREIRKSLPDHKQLEADLRKHLPDPKLIEKRAKQIEKQAKKAEKAARKRQKRDVKKKRKPTAKQAN